MLRFLIPFLPAWLIAWCLEFGGCLLHIHHLRGGFTGPHPFHRAISLVLEFGGWVSRGFALHTLAECLLIAILLALPPAAPLRHRPRLAWLAAPLVAALSILVQLHLGRLSLPGGLLEKVFPIIVVTTGCLAFSLVYSILSARVRRQSDPAGGD